MDSKQLTPVLIIALITGLVGSIYLYTEAQTELRAAITETQKIQQELSQITTDYQQLASQIATLNQLNAELEERIEELESQPPEPPVVVEETTLVLNITGEGSVRNVILLIGDGMGVGQVSAAEIENGEEILSISSMPYKSLVTTFSTSSFVTDSAAAGTAIATGSKTINGRISISANGETLTTVLEAAEELGYSTGVISTTRVTHATPASFMSHVNSRDMESAIAGQILGSGVDVVMGGGSSYFTGVDFSGYTVVTDRDGLMSVDSGDVFGLFSTSHMSYDLSRDPLIEPSLSEMTRKSIELLSDDPDGFFLMVEGGRIDHASHSNDYDSTLGEVYAFDLAVLEALEYAAGRNDTLVIVTADHETGGLMVTGGYGSSTVVEWLSDDHTGSMVPVYAYGPRGESVLGFTDNTVIGVFLLSLFQ